jgi:hypothetical protein
LLAHTRVARAALAALPLPLANTETSAYLCSRAVSSPFGLKLLRVGRRVRAGAHAYLGPGLGLATGVGDMMVMGFPLEEVAVRLLGLWRPSTAADIRPAGPPTGFS